MDKVTPHKLTPSQRRALEFLAKGEWATPWWGGKPFTGWPPELKERSYDALSRLRLVTTRRGSGADTVVGITDAGCAALDNGQSS